MELARNENNCRKDAERGSNTEERNAFQVKKTSSALMAAEPENLLAFGPDTEVTYDA